MVNWQNIDEIKLVINKSFSISESLRNLGLKVFRNNRIKFKKIIAIYKIDTSHFFTTRTLNFQMLKKEEIFITNSKRQNKSLKKKNFRYKLLEYKCAFEECGNIGLWKGKELSLHLDHINGINNDNRLENLRFLCPNCHEQEPTSNKGKIRKIERIRLKKENYKPKVRYKIDWPDDTKFQEMLNTYPVKKIANKLNVSDRVVAKTARKRNLIIPTDVHGRGYWLKKDTIRLD